MFSICSDSDHQVEPPSPEPTLTQAMAMHHGAHIHTPHSETNVINAQPTDDELKNNRPSPETNVPSHQSIEQSFNDLDSSPNQKISDQSVDDLNLAHHQSRTNNNYSIDLSELDTSDEFEFDFYDFQPVAGDIDSSLKNSIMAELLSHLEFPPPQEEMPVTDLDAYSDTEDDDVQIVRLERQFLNNVVYPEDEVMVNGGRGARLSTITEISEEAYTDEEHEPITVEQNQRESDVTSRTSEDLSDRNTSCNSTEKSIDVEETHTNNDSQLTIDSESLHSDDMTSEQDMSYFIDVPDMYPSPLSYTKKTNQNDNDSFYFVRPLKDRQVTEGSEVTFTVAVSLPDVRAHWFFDQNEIFPDDKYKLIDGSRSHLLVVRDVGVADEGEYVCSVAGHMTTCYLMVDYGNFHNSSFKMWWRSIFISSILFLICLNADDRLHWIRRAMICIVIIYNTVM